jgi:hypothetical protein
MSPNKTIPTTKNAGRNHEIERGSKNHQKTTNTNISTTKAKTGHVLRPLSENPTTKNVKKNLTSEQWRQKALVNNEED